MEFFYRVLGMRLCDGFILVNRYTGTSDYFHLVKVLRAYKDYFNYGGTHGQYNKYGQTASAAASEDKYKKVQ